jgi:hypothetical protein
VCIAVLVSGGQTARIRSTGSGVLEGAMADARSEEDKPERMARGQSMQKRGSAALSTDGGSAAVADGGVFREGGAAAQVDPWVLAVAAPAIQGGLVHAIRSDLVASAEKSDTPAGRMAWYIHRLREENAITDAEVEQLQQIADIILTDRDPAEYQPELAAIYHRLVAAHASPTAIFLAGVASGSVVGFARPVPRFAEDGGAAGFNMDAMYESLAAGALGGLIFGGIGAGTAAGAVEGLAIGAAAFGFIQLMYQYRGLH